MKQKKKKNEGKINIFNITLASCRGSSFNVSNVCMIQILNLTQRDRVPNMSFLMSGMWDD